MTTSAAMALTIVDPDTKLPPSVDVPGNDAPVRKIDSNAIIALGQNMSKLFETYKSDRVIQEERWMRNLRQYLGYYDPDTLTKMDPERSKAYPKLTRVKCISTLARIMDLMFPSDDRNWTLEADPSADMDIEDVKAAVMAAQALDAAANPGQPTPPLTEDYVTSAVKQLATKRARKMSEMIDDQLTEIGGDQTYDYVQLNNEVVASGIMYGIGILHGPYVRKVDGTTWKWNATTNQPEPDNKTHYKPQFEVLNVWEYYPDLSSKRLGHGEGYFTRKVMSKQGFRKLADRSDFFGDVIKHYLGRNQGMGNYKEQKFETELRSMGVNQNVNSYKTETPRFEIIIWHGYVDGVTLQKAGVEVDDDKLSDQMEAEVWTIDSLVIKVDLNPWVELKMDVQTLHTFIFDKDDTAPIGFGLPNIMRDTQMSLCAAWRMLLDNASVVCGPSLELNTSLLRADQDMTAMTPWKIFYRDDEGQSSMNPAVREVKIEGHIQELMTIVDQCIKFSDMETFVNPMTGGDMTKVPSEPMRNVAGASMLLGNAALPFKQIIRNFDKFTESVILSLVQFNRQFNDDRVEAAHYQVIARGATSLIAKEVRGMQIDALSAGLTPEERMHVDARKLVEAKFRVRDMADMLVSNEEYLRLKAAADSAAGMASQLDQSNKQATIRNLYAMAYKAMTQAQKNQVAANSEAVSMALDILEKHGDSALAGNANQGPAAGVDPINPGQQPGPAAPALPGVDPGAQGLGADPNVGLPPGPVGGMPVGGQGLQ